MYGSPRFLDQNLVTDESMFSASMQAAGIVSGTAKTGTGTASMYAVGNYSGSSNLTYIVQCDGVGTVDSGATVRWKTSDTAAGAWEASAQSAVTSLSTLSNAVQIAFTAGTLIEGDTWFFDANATYGVANLLNFDRNRVWRSDEWSNLLSNADFESGFTAGLADNWSKEHSSQTYTEETSEVHTAGGSAQKIECADDGYGIGIFQAESVTTDKEYYIEAWVYINSARNVRLVHSNLNSGSSQVMAVSSATWTKLTWIAIATGTGSANLRIYQTNSECTISDYLIIDDVKMYEIPTLTIDLGSAQQFTVFLTGDHNFSDNATITVSANSSDSWESPAYSNTFSTLPDLLNLYTTQTYQYIRLSMCDPDNSLGYVQLSHLYVGIYRALSVAHAEWKSSLSYGFIGIESTSVPGSLRQFVYGEQKAIELNWPILNNDDIAILVDFQANLIDLDTGLISSFFMHLFNDEEDYLYIVNWVNIKAFKQQFMAYLLNEGVPMQVVEVFKGRS